MQVETRAFFILLSLPVLWGITFPLIHIVVTDYDPSLFVLWRFILAGAFLLPTFIFAFFQRRTSPIDARYGLIIGVINSGAFIMQAMALQHIGSSRTAFLSGMNVVMVPLLLPLFGLGHPKYVDLIAALLCMVGIYLISDANVLNFHFGDFLAICSALCIALGIIMTEKASAVTNNIKLLTFYQIIFTNFIPVAILREHIFILPRISIFWWGAIYCAIFGTVIPLFLQLKYQRFVGSSKVAIIFSLESVTATFCAWLIGEHITLPVIIGGGIILTSCIYSNIYQLLIDRIRRLR